jgi:hypothetical protein
MRYISLPFIHLENGSQCEGVYITRGKKVGWGKSENQMTLQMNTLKMRRNRRRRMVIR